MERQYDVENKFFILGMAYIKLNQILGLCNYCYGMVVNNRKI